MTQGVVFPTSDLGLGTDTSCTDSLKTGRVSSGVRLVAESYYRRLITPRGTLIGGEEEADFGLDLADLCGSVQTKSDVASLEGKIIAELSKDERTETVSADVVRSIDSAGLVSFVITIRATTSAGPFTLVLGVSSATVELLGIS